MHIPRLQKTPEVNDIPKTFDAQGIAYEKVCCINWKDYPYCPESKVRLAISDSHLLVHYSVNEECVRAEYGTDGGQVWTDSCMEIFIALNQQSSMNSLEQSFQSGIRHAQSYINIECNCIGTLLMAKGPNRNSRTPLTLEELKSVKRWASLGRTTFPQRHKPTHWEVALAIPLDLIGNPKDSLCFNVYKCGDNLPTPHFLSLFPILSAEPNFHTPAFFQEVPLG
ncbi:MAG: hypothetical protein J5814_07330 [Bacteroidaceae bacterium]|nr:hypothetical protein [Bacteroidaceae bacterium]